MARDGGEAEDPELLQVVPLSSSALGSDEVDANFGVVVAAADRVEEGGRSSEHGEVVEETRLELGGDVALSSKEKRHVVPAGALWRRRISERTCLEKKSAARVVAADEVDRHEVRRGHVEAKEAGVDESHELGVDATARALQVDRAIVGSELLAVDVGEDGGYGFVVWSLDPRLPIRERRIESGLFGASNDLRMSKVRVLVDVATGVDLGKLDQHDAQSCARKKGSTLTSRRAWRALGVPSSGK